MHFHLNKPPLEKETLISVVFIILALFITQFKLYAILAILLLLFNYYVSQNSLRAIWSTIVIVTLIPQAKYFPEQIFSLKQFLDLGKFPVIYSYSLTLTDILIPIGIYLIYKLRKDLTPHLKNENNHLMLIMISIIFLAVISSIQSNFPNISFFNTYILIKFFCIYLIGKIISRSQPSIQKLTIEIIIIYTLINSIIIILQLLHHGPLGIPLEILNNPSTTGIYADENPDLYRPSGIEGSPNLYASIITMALILSMVINKSRNIINRQLIISSIVIGAAALIATASRAAWVITFFLTLIMALQKEISFKQFLPKKMRVIKFPLIILISTIFITLILPRLTSLNKIFQPRGGGFYRLRHIEIGKDLLMNYPFGVGLNIFQFEIVKQYPANYIYADSTPAHNAFAEIGSDLGFIGIVLFLLMYNIIIKNAYNSKEFLIINKSIFWALISYLISIQFHPWILERPIAELFWILSGVMIDENRN